MALRLLLPLLFIAGFSYSEEVPPRAPKQIHVSQQPASAEMIPGEPDVVAGGFSIAVVPDTQFYAEKYPDIFHKQTQWIADNAAKYNIKFMIQVGDVTQTSVDAEWMVGRDAFKRLEGKVPFASAPGNHDYGGRLQVHTHRSPFSSWLPLSMFQAMPTFGGVYDKLPEKADNQWHTFDAGGRKWLVIGLEFAPRPDVLRWASDVIGAHPEHSAVIFTHAYLDPRTNERMKLSIGMGKIKGRPESPESALQPNEKPDITSGEDLWQQVASKHANVVMVLCGHASYTNHCVSKGGKGHLVREMVVDYQRDVNGGNGWMRMLQVLPDGKTVRCQDFSPWIGQKCTMPDRTFDFELPIPAPAK